MYGKTSGDPIMVKDFSDFYFGAPEGSFTIALPLAFQQVLKNSLKLLGIEAPDRM